MYTPGSRGYGVDALLISPGANLWSIVCVAETCLHEAHQ